MLEASLEEVPPSDFYYWPEHEQACLLFFRASSQWVFSSMGQRMGLDYQKVESMARLMGVDITPEMFNDICLIEQGAVSALVEQHEKEAKKKS